MVSLKIKEVLKYNEYVVEGKNIKENIVLVIYGLDNRLDVDDSLMMHENLLDKNSRFYTMPISFELTNEKTPAEIKEENNKEYGAIKTNKKTYAIKRIYG